MGNKVTTNNVLNTQWTKWTHVCWAKQYNIYLKTKLKNIALGLLFPQSFLALDIFYKWKGGGGNKRLGQGI